MKLNWRIAHWLVLCVLAIPVMFDQAIDLSELQRFLLLAVLIGGLVILLGSMSSQRAVAAQEGEARFDTDEQGQNTIFVFVYYMIAAVVVIGILFALLAKRVMPAPVLTTIETQGYYLEFWPRARRCGKNRECIASAKVFMGVDPAGRCYSYRYPFQHYDESLCRIRLRQIDANSCKIESAHDDHFCATLLADLAEQRAIRKKGTVLFRIEDGRSVAVNAELKQ